MAGSGCGSPCGACKFLRRKCVNGCVFAPYFGHEQGASHFAAIHKVFGASNVSKLLSHLPVTDRCEAAVTISFEAQARLQDPIYGCVSHIFALQQQVVNLQAQLASMRELQTAQSFTNGSGAVNPNGKFLDKAFPQNTQSQDHHVHGSFDFESSSKTSYHQLVNNSNYISCESGVINPNPIGNSYGADYSPFPVENGFYRSFEDGNSYPISSNEIERNKNWHFQRFQ